MNKMEKYLIMPLKLKFYCRYVDDTYNRRNKNKSDEPFERMNKYHSNINLTIEVNPPKFLDTRIHRNKNKIKCFAYHKINEITIPLDVCCSKTLQEEYYYWRPTSH